MAARWSNNSFLPCTPFFWASETFQVGKANVGDVAVCGFGNGGEQVDFFLVVGAHLDHHKFGLRRGAQQRQWHANVVVEVAQGGVNLHALASTSRMSSFVVVLPLLPVMASTGQSSACGKPVPRLQGVQHVFHHRDVGSAFPLPFRAVADDMGRPLVQGVFHKVVAVEVVSFQGQNIIPLSSARVSVDTPWACISGRKAINCGVAVQKGDHGVTSGKENPTAKLGVRCSSC